MKIVLIGFMGSGKTTIAGLLAKKLHFDVVEMDETIIVRSGHSSISEMFRREGELAFRKLETEVAHSLYEDENTVISTGGGVVSNSENMLWLSKGKSVVVWLKSPFETLALRVKGDASRPLFLDVVIAKELFDSRLPLYEKYADLCVDTEHCSPEQIVESILSQLPQKKQNNLLSCPNISGRTKLCVIVGDPVAHSLSPAMHNAAYAAVGLGDAYVYVAAQVKRGELKRAVDGMKSMGFRGLTCTIPHKVDIFPFLDDIEPAAKMIGAVNTVVQQDDRLLGANTDWLGMINPLRKKTEITGKTIGMIGAGGTTRAAIYGLQQCHAGKIVLFNRTLEKAQKLAEEFGCVAFSLDAMPEQLPGCDVIIQTTSVGMEPDIGGSLVPISCLHSEQIVMDAIYTPFETQLLRDAKKKGAKIIRGAEMFLEQGLAQFEYYTGEIAPYDVMKQVVCAHFGVSSF